MDAKKYNAEIIAMYAAGMLISDITEITGADSDYIKRIATPDAKRKRKKSRHKDYQRRHRAEINAYHRQYTAAIARREEVRAKNWADVRDIRVDQSAYIVRMIGYRAGECAAAGLESRPVYRDMCALWQACSGMQYVDFCDINDFWRKNVRGYVLHNGQPCGEFAIERCTDKPPTYLDLIK